MGWHCYALIIYCIPDCILIEYDLLLDKIELSLWQDGKETPVQLLRTGIAWPTDKRVKFRNPKGRSLEEGKKFFFTTLYKKRLSNIAKRKASIHLYHNLFIKNNDLYDVIDHFPNNLHL